MVRVVFDEELRKQEAPSLRVMERDTKNLTRGRVVGDGEGFHVMDPDSPGGEFYFHGTRAAYSRLWEGYLRSFPKGYELTLDLTVQIPEFLRIPFSRFMARNEHAFLGVATEKLPGHKMSEMRPEDAEVFAWGNVDYDRLRTEASSRGISLEDCLAGSVPRIDIANGHEFLHTPLRGDRPNGQLEIFRSHYYGYHDGNPEAIRDMLWALVRKRKLDINKRTIDNAVADPRILIDLGVGSMVDGHGIVLSFDTPESNRRFSAALDHPLSPNAYARDLSPLGFEGVRALTYTNRFQPFPRRVDPRFAPFFQNLGYRLGVAGENGIPLGIAAVTYSTEFETSPEQRTPDGYFAMLTSQQLTARRVAQLLGWKYVAIVMGQNDGVAASSGQWHRQLYLIETKGMVPRAKRHQPLKENILYEDGGVRLVALGFGHVGVHLRSDGDYYERSLLDREQHELRSLAYGLSLNDLILHRLGFVNKSEYTRGNDQAVRVLPPDELALKTGIGEMSLLRRFATSSEHAVPVRRNIPGDFYGFLADYRGLLKDFFHGKLVISI